MKTIAISGKGGSGKTTISALIIKCLRERGETPILAVDADANSNLNEALGVEVHKKIGTVREEAIEEIKTLPMGVLKESHFEYRIHEAIVEAEGFDLIVMGRPEGPGCYCYANLIFRKYIDAIQRGYRYIIMDCEAGMEHLSRRTTRDVDLLLIVSDPTLRGIRTGGRIRKLAREELELNIKKDFFLINRANSLPKDFLREVEREKLHLIGVVPEDASILEYDLMGKPIFLIPDESPALQALRDISDSIRKELYA